MSKFKPCEISKKPGKMKSSLSLVYRLPLPSQYCLLLSSHSPLCPVGYFNTRNVWLMTSCLTYDVTSDSRRHVWLMTSHLTHDVTSSYDVTSDSWHHVWLMTSRLTHDATSDSWRHVWLMTSRLTYDVTSDSWSHVWVTAGTIRSASTNV